MGHMRSIIAGIILAVVQTASAYAADLGPPPPPMAPEPCCASDWYLKGFMGITSYDVDSIDTPLFDTADFTIFDTGFEGSGFAGLGLGYKFNDWLRFDVTSEYRNRATFHALDAYDGGSFSGTDQYTATLKSWVSLANFYWDIGCWQGITPYVGGGVGYAKNWIGDYTDINTPNLGVAFANTHSDGSLAWAVHAGLSYDVTRNFTVDLAYRYLDIGDAQSGTIHAYDNSSVAPGLEFNDITSHDVMLSARYKFGCCGGEAPMPVSFK